MAFYYLLTLEIEDKRTKDLDPDPVFYRIRNTALELTLKWLVMMCVKKRRAVGRYVVPVGKFCVRRVGQISSLSLSELFPKTTNKYKRLLKDGICSLYRTIALYSIHSCVHFVFYSSLKYLTLFYN